MRRNRIFSTLALLLALAGGAAASAQTGGQFCVRAFEDRNGNQVLDPGEPFLTRDVAAALLDAGGIVIASALMDDSPTAAQGVICFQFLPAGQYTMQITSAAYTPTTPDTVTAAIGAGTLPTVVEFGARRTDALAAAPTVTAPASGALTLPDSDLVRVGLSVLGALVVMGALAALGLLVYLLAVRPRPAAPATPASAVPPVRRPPTTGSGTMPPVKAVSDDYLNDMFSLEDEDKPER
jgi:hypothetical protein